MDDMVSEHMVSHDYIEGFRTLIQAGFEIVSNVLTGLLRIRRILYQVHFNVFLTWMLGHLVLSLMDNGLEQHSKVYVAKEQYIQQ